MLYCTGDNDKCPATLKDDLDAFDVDQVITMYDWTPSCSWQSIVWDGRIWCPEHAVEADDFWGEHSEDNQ